MFRMSLLMFAFLVTRAECQVKAVLKMDDGSTVRVTVDTPAVELQTKYGKLSIPLADVKRIDFAHRIPPDKRDAIHDAAANLAHGDYRTRAKAQECLVSHGRNAWLVLARRTAILYKKRFVGKRPSAGMSQA